MTNFPLTCGHSVAQVQNSMTRRAEREVIDRFIAGRPLAIALAVALFGVIGRQSYMPRTIN
jgi:hypothetical protein